MGTYKPTNRGAIITTIECTNLDPYTSTHAGTNITSLKSTYMGPHKAANSITISYTNECSNMDTFFPTNVDTNLGSHDATFYSPYCSAQWPIYRNTYLLTVIATIHEA